MRRTMLSFLFASLLLCTTQCLKGAWALFPSLESTDLKRVLVTEALQEGAVCLDGSPPGYYYREGSGGGETSFLIFIEGGGWCSSPENCYDRSNTFLGSSTQWPPTKPVDRPIFSTDPQVNPDFYNFNIINFGYCDGASFSGNRREPMVVQGKEIYFRGHLVLEHLMKHLLQNTDIEKADKVMLSGCSAGGVATILYADYIRSFFDKTEVVFKSVSFSGFFPDASSYDGSPVLYDLVKDVYAMQNVSSSLNSRCMKDHSVMGKDPHACFMSQYAYLYVESPIYLVNSVYDAWTVEHIYNITSQRWKDASEELKVSMLEYLNMQAKATFDLITNALPWSRSRNGGFLHTCLTHCGGCCTNQGWDKTVIHGRTLRDSLGDWFFERNINTTTTTTTSSTSTSTSVSWMLEQATPLPCHWSLSPPYQCNPTCGDEEEDTGFMSFFGEVGQNIGQMVTSGIQNATSRMWSEIEGTLQELG